jgi:ribonuclease P protein subunit POP4
MDTLDEVTRHELIGLTAKISKAKNKDLEGLSGKIIGETRNSIVIESDSKRKRVLKNQLIEIILVEKKVKVQAKALMKRPEERIKGE